MHQGTTLVLLFYNELGPDPEHHMGSLSLSKLLFFQEICYSLCNLSDHLAAEDALLCCALIWLLQTPLVPPEHP